MIMQKRILAVFAAVFLVFVLCGCDGGNCNDPHQHSYDPVTYKCDCGKIDPNHPHYFVLTHDKTAHWSACPYCGDIYGSKQLHDFGEFLRDDESRICSVCNTPAEDGFLSSIVSILCSCGSFFGMCRDLFSSFPFVFRLTVYFVFGAILFLAIQRIIREVGK